MIQSEHLNGWYAAGALLFAIVLGLLLAALGDRRTRRDRAAKAEADRRFLEGRSL